MRISQSPGEDDEIACEVFLGKFGGSVVCRHLEGLILNAVQGPEESQMTEADAVGPLDSMVPCFLPYLSLFLETQASTETVSLVP